MRPAPRLLEGTARARSFSTSPGLFVTVLVVAGLVVVGMVAAGSASAAPAPLRGLPEDKLAAMEPMLRHGDIALVESEPSGLMRQVTVMAFTHAPAATVREVLLAPERWREFVPALTRTRVVRAPGGRIEIDFEMDVKLLKIGTHSYIDARPDGQIEVIDADPTDHSTLRWLLLPAPGGTIIVEYGYTDVRHAGGLLKRLLDGAPLLEHGLGLSLQMAYLRAIKLRAESLATAAAAAATATTATTAAVSAPSVANAPRSPGFGFLLERGRVAVMRSGKGGRLADISILDTVYAPPERIVSVLAQPAEYPRFIEGVSHVGDIRADGEATDYDLDFSLSMLRFSSRYALRHAPAAVDVVALDGDLRGAHMRWDLVAHGPRETLVTFRANVDLGAASPLVLGSIFRAAPLFEHGIAVAHGLMQVVGVRGRVEGWK